jgi:hypothetical protein
MKRITTSFIILLIFNIFPIPTRSQEAKGFGFEPWLVLKTWNYETLRAKLGNGEEVLASMRNQSYVAGLRYPFEMLGISGKLEFTFAKDSIRMIHFRRALPERKIGPDIAERIIKDTTFRKEYNRSLQINDSLRRDSVVRSVSGILGVPVSMGKTSSTEKNAKYAAVWANRGYSCQFKEFLGYADIVFTLSTAPPVIAGEFQIPANTQIIQKVAVNTKKMSWTASLLATPAVLPKTAYSDYFILLEFSTGQRYLEIIPKAPGNYLQTKMVVEFSGGRAFLLSVPGNPTGYLADLQFDDFDGDAIPEAWIRIPSDPTGVNTRHYLYSLPFREPNLVLNSDELQPATIELGPAQKIRMVQQDGTIADLDYPGLQEAGRKVTLYPNGFSYFKASGRNTDGTSDFTGGITLGKNPGILELPLKHVKGGWEAGQPRLVTISR